MTRYFFSACFAVITMQLGGCSPSLSGPVASLRFNGNYTSARADIVTDNPLLLPISVRTPHSMQHPNYRAYFWPSSPGSTVSVLFSHPVTEIVRGWIHLRGKQPAAKTNRLYAMAVASEFVVRVFTPPASLTECEWIVNMSSSQVRVWVLPIGPVDLHALATTTPIATLDNNEYFQYCDGGTSIVDGPWSGDVEDFINNEVIPNSPLR